MISGINKKTNNSIQKVLVTHASKKKKNQLIGKNPNNRIVKFYGDRKLIGEEVNIKINSFFLNNFRGELI